MSFFTLVRIVLNLKKKLFIDGANIHFPYNSLRPFLPFLEYTYLHSISFLKTNSKYGRSDGQINVLSIGSLPYISRDKQEWWYQAYKKCPFVDFFLKIKRNLIHPLRNQRIEFQWLLYLIQNFHIHNLSVWMSTMDLISHQTKKTPIFDLNKL